MTAIPEQYSIEIKNRFEALMALQEEMTPDKMANHARDVFISTAKTISKIKKSKETNIFIKRNSRINRRKKNSKKNGNLNRNQKEYKSHTKEIRKRARQDKKQFINNKCNTIETLNELWKDGEMFKEIKALTREFKPPVNQVINDKTGNAVTENEDILKRGKEYCSEMFMDKDTNQ